MGSARHFLLAGLLLNTSAQAQTTTHIVTDEVVVTPTRFEQPADQTTPVGVTIIPAAQIRESGVQSLPQLLSQQSGIGVRDNFGSPDPQIDLRGFGVNGDQNTLVLVDGMRLNDNELTTARWSSIPLENIERVEIIRGSGAVLYGAGATGGVINIITRAPKPGQNSADLALRGGSYDARGGAASAALAGDEVGVRAGVRYDETDNYRQHNALLQRNADLAVRTLGDGASLRFAGGADAQNLQLPGARSNTQLLTDRRAATTPNDFADRETEYARLTGTAPVGAGEIAADLGYRHKRTNALFFGTTEFDSDVTEWDFTPRVRLPYAALGAAHALIAGFDYEDWEYNSVRTGPAHIEARQINRALYLQHTTDFPTDTRLALGVRGQRSAYEARDVDSGQPYAGGSQDRKLYASEVALRQGWAQTAVYAKAGRSFRIATVDEVYSQFGGPLFDARVAFLEPQTSTDRELGVEFARPGTSVRLAAFQMRVRNEIHLNAVTFENVNLPPTERRGIEFDLHQSFARRYDLSASYTYTEAKFTDATLNGVDVSGNSMPLVPRHRASLGIGVNATERTRLGATATYTASQYFDGDEANNFGQKMPAYTVVDFRLSHVVAGWTFAAVINNAFNAHYFSYAVRSQFSPGVFNAYPQPERNYFLSAEYRFRL